VLWGDPASSVGLDTHELRITVPGGVHPASVVALNADADKQLELAILTDQGVYLAKLDSTRVYNVAKEPVIDAGAVRGEIHSADVDDDGLPDLVFSDGVALRWALAIPNNPGPGTQP
jgi:hypothetical protein